jgi:flagella basal body P-ring formation protein FlgA
LPQVVAAQHDIRIIGREDAVVTTDAVRLSDVAQVSATTIDNDDVVIALQKLQIGRSPNPGKEVLIPAASVLEKLRRSGVNLRELGYSFPRMIRVKRAARQLRPSEVEQVIEQYLASSGRDLSLRTMQFEEEVFVAPGEIDLIVRNVREHRAGKMSFELQAFVPGAPDVPFHVQAQVDEWSEVPVATRALSRGVIVSENDVALARVNLAKLVSPIEQEKQAVIGMELSREVGYGEAFTAQKLVVPPLIPAGAKVTMVYKGQFFEATATGITLEPGLPGQPVKVRNDASRKVVVGTAREPGLVEVTQ